VTTPWPAMLRLAAGTLRIPPEAFWRLSLKEWRALTEGEAADALDRVGLEALARLYPD
jgi:uncharacterized phage protein (TIGR02216 family)